MADSGYFYFPISYSIMSLSLRLLFISTTKWVLHTLLAGQIIAFLPHFWPVFLYFTLFARFCSILMQKGVNVMNPFFIFFLLFCTKWRKNCQKVPNMRKWGKLAKKIYFFTKCNAQHPFISQNVQHQIRSLLSFYTFSSTL